MRQNLLRRSLFLLSTMALVLGSLPGLAMAATPTGVDPVHGKGPSPEVIPVCPGPAGPDTARCHSAVRPNATSSPTGLSPTIIKSVYGFSVDPTAGNGQTIAIVDAYDAPTAEDDLNVFSQRYGLPACTTANGCFQKVDQGGGTNYPRKDSGWALEISLDIQWAHAIAPGAKVLLVEAKNNSYSNLLAAVNYAKAHANYVSMSWGSSEFSGEAGYDAYFVQPGVSFFASSGDSGLPASYPSASPKVISVGGTTLNFDSAGTFASETGWSGSGGGCSAYEPATSDQSGFSQYPQVNCGGMRATPDVSLNADPASGMSVYDSTSYLGQSGWWTVGGTSASAPMWAARAAVAATLVDASYVYGNSITYRDIMVGNNGASCLVGYDLVTGRGSWTSSSAPSASFGIIAGTVTQADNVTPIAGASVTVQGTSLSATTDTSGAYGIGNVPQGTNYSVSASALGFAGQTVSGIAVNENTTTTVNFRLAASTPANLVTVSSITYTTFGGKTGDKNLQVTVALIDNLGNPVAGASVSVQLNLGSSAYGSGSGTTGTGGTVSFNATNTSSGCYTTTVTSVTAAGLPWDGLTPANGFCK